MVSNFRSRVRDCQTLDGLAYLLGDVDGAFSGRGRQQNHEPAPAITRDNVVHAVQRVLQCPCDQF